MQGEAIKMSGHAVSPRRPWVAALMSLVLPGFGQLYNGEPNRAVWLFFLFGLIGVPVTAFLVLHVSSWLLLPALLVTQLVPVAIWVYSVIDAMRRARRLGSYSPARWQTSGMYLVVFLVCHVLVLPASVMYTRTHFVESFRVPAVSMEPTILRGDILFADKRYNCRGCKSAVRRGDIAVFTYPDNRTLLFVKRIIALPGDRVRAEGRQLIVNGKPLSAPGDRGEDGRSTEQIDGRSWQVQWGDSGVAPMELTVPSGQVFVLGDNRGNSVDSRFFGTVPMEDVIGRARQVWFSAGSDGIRWGRIGTTVD